MKLEFWYDFASTYSYLSAMRIEELAARAGIDLIWRPFILGPIFKAQGWTTSPFNLYPAKGRYMVRDIERVAVARGHAFSMPAQFPANSLLAARIALTGEPHGWTPRFTKAVFAAEFAQGKDIGDAGFLAGILDQFGIDSNAALREAGSQPSKDALRNRTIEAEQRGIFGAPTFVTPDGELFWGDDRLEQALAWAKR